MSKYYNSLVRSLNQAIEYTEGNRKLKTETVILITIKIDAADKVKKRFTTEGEPIITALLPEASSDQYE